MVSVHAFTLHALSGTHTTAKVPVPMESEVNPGAGILMVKVEFVRLRT
jgi:hypothetical protein